jgi:hypothetical protein
MATSAKPTYSLIGIALALAMAPALTGCSKSADDSTAATKSQAAENHDGQGASVTTDPQMVLTLKFDDQAVTVPLKGLSIYESKPAAAGGKQAPQGFELEGEKLMLAGRLPDGLAVAPSRKFQQLVGQSLEIRPVGGEASFSKMSKITLSDQKVYVAKQGTLKVKNAFYHPGKYAGVSGDVEVVLQQIKLGDTDDPNNKGDQPIGEPKTVTGTFACPATSVPYEQM